MRHRHIIAIVFSSLVLSACSPTAPEATNTPSDATPTAGHATATSDQAQAAGALPGVITVDPNPIDVCNLEPKLAEVDVSWDLTAAQVRDFNVWVEAPSEERKIWISSFEAVDTKRTGKWVRENTKFTIIATDGRELASAMVSAAACP